MDSNQCKKRKWEVSRHYLSTTNKRSRSVPSQTAWRFGLLPSVLTFYSVYCHVSSGSLRPLASQVDIKCSHHRSTCRVSHHRIPCRISFTTFTMSWMLDIFSSVCPPSLQPLQHINIAREPFLGTEAQPSMPGDSHLIGRIR